MAHNGEIPDLGLEDLVPIAVRSRVRRGESSMPFELISSDDSGAEDKRNPRSMVWLKRVLDDLTSVSSRKIAAAALEALQKVDQRSHQKWKPEGVNYVRLQDWRQNREAGVFGALPIRLAVRRRPGVC